MGRYRKSLTGVEAHEQKTLQETVPAISGLAFDIRQKVQFEDTEQASEPKSGMEGMLEL